MNLINIVLDNIYIPSHKSLYNVNIKYKKEEKKYNYLIIDYVIILKQIMKSKNIYFPNNFYKTWVEYLLPIYGFDKNNIYYD